MDVLNLIGRMLYGGYFIYNGLNHLLISPDMLTGALLMFLVIPQPWPLSLGG